MRTVKARMRSGPTSWPPGRLIMSAQMCSISASAVPNGSSETAAESRSLVIITSRMKARPRSPRGMSYAIGADDDEDEEDEDEDEDEEEDEESEDEDEDDDEDEEDIATL